MKTRYRLLSGLLGMLLLSGCSTVMGEREETGEATSNASADAQTYREVILQLQQQLEEMRQAQLQQADDYEREIAELEAVFSDPDFYTKNGSRSSELQAELEKLRARCDQLYARWEELETKQYELSTANVQ